MSIEIGSTAFRSETTATKGNRKWQITCAYVDHVCRGSERRRKERTKRVVGQSLRSWKQQIHTVYIGYFGEWILISTNKALRRHPVSNSTVLAVTAVQTSNNNVIQAYSISRSFYFGFFFLQCRQNMQHFGPMAFLLYGLRRPQCALRSTFQHSHERGASICTADSLFTHNRKTV